MKHVRESLKEFNDYRFFSLFEEEKAGLDKESLQTKEKDGLAIIDKITKNFDEFKNDAKGEILKYKEFWEENKQNKKGFSENGNIYKLFNSDYVVGVLELPPQTLSDGSIDGGMGATDEPEEEIIEGKEIQSETEEPALGQEPGQVTEAEETEDPAMDLDLGQKPGIEDVPSEDSAGEEVPAEEPSTEEVPAEEPALAEPEKDLTSPQTYLVVYDIHGDGEEREEIFRCGSNNVVKAFDAFYNDTFKAAMKNIILQYKKEKEEEKIEAEKSEKTKKETEKQNKVKKFLGKTNESLNENIFTSEYDDTVYKIYQKIVNNFDINNLTDENDFLVYKLNDNVIKVQNNEFFAIPGYTLEINGEDIECSHLLNKKIYNFLNKKWKEKERVRKKEHIDNFNSKFNESLNEDIDLGASDMSDEQFNDSGSVSWYEEIREYLINDYEMAEEDADLFMEIADEQLQSLQDGGASAFDASGIIAADEDIWEELKRSREDEDEFEESDNEETSDDELEQNVIDDNEDAFETLRDEDEDLEDEEDEFEAIDDEEDLDDEDLGGEEDLLDDEEDELESEETEDEIQNQNQVEVEDNYFNDNPNRKNIRRAFDDER